MNTQTKGRKRQELASLLGMHVLEIAGTLNSEMAMVTFHAGNIAIIAIWSKQKDWIWNTAFFQLQNVKFN